MSEIIANTRNMLAVSLTDVPSNEGIPDSLPGRIRVVLILELEYCAETVPGPSVTVESKATATRCKLSIGSTGATADSLSVEVDLEIVTAANAVEEVMPASFV